MSKFVKKPIVIEAKRFITNNEPTTKHMDELVLWMNQGKDSVQAWHNGTNIFIKTLEGEMRADVGDWIVKGIKSEFYPCKNNIFLETYDPLKD